MADAASQPDPALVRAEFECDLATKMGALNTTGKEKTESARVGDGSEGDGGTAAAGGMSKKAAKKAAKKGGSGGVAKFRGAIEVDAGGPLVKLAACQGTRDVYPEDMRFRQWLFGHWRDVSMACNFSEYDAPLVERVELYKRKGGDEITQQMYDFTDKDGVECALRPEMTPSFARLTLQRAHGLHLPLKWFSIPQCWRFEHTVRGRKREHYQWNVDIIGVTSVAAEVELLRVITSFFSRVGLGAGDVGIKINSRKVLQSVLNSLGVGDDLFEQAVVIIDKLDKIGGDEVVKQLVELGIDGRIAKRVMECVGVESIEQLEAIVVSDGDLGAAGESLSSSIAELKEVFELSKSYGFGDWLIFDASTVRGLSYYTGIVFECFDRQGELRAICGGGRYDRLLHTYGANSEVPACGFGFGDCVIYELLKDKGLLPDLPRSVEYVVAPFNASMRGHSMDVARRIRDGPRGDGVGGARADLMLEPKKKVAQSFEYADRVGARSIVFVAPDEVERGLVRVKDLREEDVDLKSFDVPLTELGRIDAYIDAEKKKRMNEKSA